MGRAFSSRTHLAVVDGQWISQAKESGKSCTAFIPKNGTKEMKRDETHRKFQCVGLRMCRLGIEVPSSRLACERARGGGCNPHFSPQLLFFSSVELMTASDTAALGTSSCFLSLAFTSTGVGRPQRRHGTRDVHIRLLAAIKSSRSLALERGILHHGRHTRTRLALGSSPPMQCQVSITPYVLPAPSIARAGRVAAPLRPERGLARAGGRATSEPHRPIP